MDLDDIQHRIWLYALFANLLIYIPYSMLLAITIYIIRTRSSLARWNTFFLGAIFLAVTLMLMFSLLFAFESPAGVGPLFAVSGIAALSTHMFATMYLIHRCYIIWNRRTAIIFPLISLLLANLAVGIGAAATGGIVVNSAINPVVFVFLASALTTNVILTAITAGRIYWLARNCKAILGVAVTARYQMAFLMIAESGIVYNIVQLLFLIFFIVVAAVEGRQRREIRLMLNSVCLFAIFPLFVQAAGITPTLVLFRSALTAKANGDSENGPGEKKLPRVPPKDEEEDLEQEL